MKIDVCTVSIISCEHVSIKRRETARLPFHADEFQVTAEIPGIESTYGKTIAEPSHGCFEVALVEVWVQVWGLVDRGVHVCPNQRDRRSGYSTSLVGYLNGNVFVALGNDHFCDRKVLLLLAVGFDNSSERILKGLEKHVRQMAGYIHEVEIRLTDQLHLRRIKKTVVVLTNESRIFDCFLGKLLYIGFGTYDANIVRFRGMPLIRESNVLSDEHTDADT